MSKQLYNQIKDLELPSKVFLNDSANSPKNKKILESYFSYKWPNGMPCILVEMFLLHKSRFVSINKRDGGTIGNYASNLSHIVRYCYKRKLEFWELKHDHIDELVFELCNEKDISNLRVRNNNTVKTIIQSSIELLTWIQENIAVDRRIAGIDDRHTRFQIKLKKAKYKGPHGYTSICNVFPCRLPRSITPAVTPMSSDSIKKLWDTLDLIKSNGRVSNKLKGTFSKKEQSDHKEYMHKRRELQLALLEATGLRPQELVRIPCFENIKNLESSTLNIPTLKGRVDPKQNMRLIPIPRALAIKIELFITLHREKLIKRLLKANLIDSYSDVADVIYLNSENGGEVLPDAAYQEFRRLTVKSGIKQKNCQKMFRHRFITNMVKLHLISFMDKNPLKTRHVVTDNDYRTVLKKVASFTGHRNLDSLMHYIDLAWEEMDVFEYGNSVKMMQENMMSINYITRDIKSDLRSFQGKRLNKKNVDLIDTKLSEIEALLNF